jgi:hypothetical protein
MAYRASRVGRRIEPRSYSWPAILVGIVLILGGLAIIAYWAIFVTGGNMPEGLWTVVGNQYIAYHQAAELVMALLAIAGGFGLLIGRGWGMATSLAALGALLYTSVNSLGNSVRNEPPLTPIFLAVLGVTLVCFIALHFSRRY